MRTVIRFGFGGCWCCCLARIYPGWRIVSTVMILTCCFRFRFRSMTRFIFFPSFFRIVNLQRFHFIRGDCYWSFIIIETRLERRFRPRFWWRWWWWFFSPLVVINDEIVLIKFGHTHVVVILMIIDDEYLRLKVGLSLGDFLSVFFSPSVEFTSQGYVFDSRLFKFRRFAIE